VAVENRTVRHTLDGAIYLFLLTCAVITLVPFVYLVCSAVKTQAAFFTAHFLPPGHGFLGIDWSGLTLEHFRLLFTDPSLGFARAVVNSVFYASTASVLTTLCSAMGGYALAKFAFRANRPMTALVLASLIIPGPLLLAPGYQLIYRLGLLDSFAGLLLPGLAPAFGIFLFRQAMLHTVPLDMMEAARVDGCGEIRLFFTIILPLVKPMVGAFLLITFMGAWNNFLQPQIILQTPEKFPLAVAIAQLKGLYSTDYGLLMAGTLVSITPVMCLFLLLQKDFVSGLTAGAVKG
jgi:ABC-type glycerol-3-phosphate transport system permease component